MNKNPYEIRLSVLDMARSLLMEEYYAKREFITSNWQEEVTTRRTKGMDVKPCPDYPHFPTNQEILDKAKELVEFINTK